MVFNKKKEELTTKIMKYSDNKDFCKMLESNVISTKELNRDTFIFWLEQEEIEISNNEATELLSKLKNKQEMAYE